MNKAIFEQMGGHIDNTGRLLYAQPYITKQRRTPHLHVKTTLFAVLKATPQNFVL